MLRQALAITICVLLGGPVWGISNPLGTVASADGVSVAGTVAANGSTLYDGDTLSVQPNGNASLVLAGGSRVRMGADSQTRISRDGSAIALELERGKVEFTSSSQSPVEGQIADVTFRPESPSQTSVGYMTLDDSNHTALYADRGNWLVTSADNGRSMILHPGEHIDGVVSAAQNQDQDNTAQGQQKKRKKKKMAVIWIGTALAGTVTGLGMAFGMSECNVNSTNSDSSCSESPSSPSNQIIPQE